MSELAEATDNPKKVKKCLYCKLNIDSEAKVCNHCQSRQNNFAHYLYYASAVIAMLMVILAFMQFQEAQKQAEAAKTDALFAQKASRDANVALKKAIESANQANFAKIDANNALGKAKEAERKANLARIETKKVLFEMKENQKAAMISELSTIRTQITGAHNDWLTNEGRKNAICSDRGVSPSTPHLLLEPQKTHWHVAQDASDNIKNYENELIQKAQELEEKIENYE